MGPRIHVGPSTPVGLLSIFGLFVVASCANQGGPPGGPADRTGPQVVTTFPDTFEVLAAFDDDIRIGIGAGRVVDGERRLARAFRQDDLAQGNAQVRRGCGNRMHLAGGGQRTGRDRGLDVLDRDVHGAPPFRQMMLAGCANARQRQADGPEARRTGTVVKPRCPIPPPA